jgi:hypothetical protein
VSQIIPNAKNFHGKLTASQKNAIKTCCEELKNNYTEGKLVESEFIIMIL